MTDYEKIELQIKAIDAMHGVFVNKDVCASLEIPQIHAMRDQLVELTNQVANALIEPTE